MNLLHLLTTLAPRTRRQAPAALLAGMLLIAGCGGGGGDGVGPAAGTATPGATATAYTEGTISGFGSVIVNGVRFDETQARITDDDDMPHPASALHLGMRVAVDSDQMNQAAGTARALAMRFGGQVTGPVEAVNTTAGTLTVLGQGVDVTADTVFDDRLVGGMAAIAVGAVVEVHGLPDAATGRITATRIEPEAGATAYKLRGTVAALNTTAKTFQIGSAVISYASLASTAVPAALADGNTLRVTLATAQVASQWVALSLGHRPTRPIDGSLAHVRGTISAFTSATSFSVDGLAVDASGAAFPDGSTGLALGVQVDVIGSIANGTLVATKVALEGRHRGDDDRRMELHGAITAIDTSAKTFVLRGVTVSYAGSVSYQGGTEADLLVGAKVEVKGGLGSTRTQIVAATIHFESGMPSMPMMN